MGPDQSLTYLSLLALKTTPILRTSGKVILLHAEGSSQAELMGTGWFSYIHVQCAIQTHLKLLMQGHISHIPYNDVSSVCVMSGEMLAWALGSCTI